MRHDIVKQLRQAMYLVRAKDDIKLRIYLEQAFALLLRCTAAHADDKPRPLLFHVNNSSYLRYRLVMRVFPDGAGVEEDDIGIGAACRFFIAHALKKPRHLAGIVHVHLAAEGMNVKLLMHGCLYGDSRLPLDGLGATRIINRTATSLIGTLG